MPSACVVIAITPFFTHAPSNKKAGIKSDAKPWHKGGLGIVTYVGCVSREACHLQ